MKKQSGNSNHPQALAAPFINQRRLFMKSAIVGAGAITFARFLPEADAQTNSVLPAVNSLLLDEGHCDVVCDSGGVDLKMAYMPADLNTFDLDFEVLTPGGTRIAPKAQNGALQGQCGLMHNGDEIFIGGSRVEEAVTVGFGSSISSGRYQLFVRPSEQKANVTVTLTIFACGNGSTAGRNMAFSNLDPVNVGSVNISSGGTPSLRLFNPI